jgi:CRP-like cAMP-binding protein
LVLLLDTAQRQGRLKEALHRAVSMYRLLIIDKIGYLPLSRDQVRAWLDSVIEAVYFPESGMISLVSNLEEGLLGASLLSGEDTSFIEAMVQMPGTALRMGKADFRHELETNAPFRALVLRYNEALQTQVMQSAACNSRHGLEQRLARWLLMAHDRADRTELPLTQEFMGMMLGVSRPSITITAGILQRTGLIRYSGGRVTVLDRSSLEAGSCECYDVVKRRFAVLLGTAVS